MAVRHPVASFPLVAASILAAGQALGQDVQWGNSAGGSFHVGANWIGGVVPGAGDFVRFSRTRNADQQLAYTVTFGSSPSNVQAAVGGDRVTFDLNGNAYLLTSQVEAMRVGTSAVATGRLTLIDGVVATTTPDASVRIGAAGGASGVLSISTGAQLLGASVVAGYLGPGTLLVQNGGDLVGGPMHVGYGAPGTATVSGAGSTMVIEDLNLASSASGTLNISTGGRVESTFGRIGQSGGAVGTVNVDGAGSRWTSSIDVYAGYTGPGVLNITGGGRVECSRAFTGTLEGGVGAANITGSGVLAAQGRCAVGYESQGSLNLTSGSLVQCEDGEVGVFAPGTATIDGSGSRWLCDSDLSVGAGTSTGALTIIGGGAARSTHGFLGKFAGTTGTVSVSGQGSIWSVFGDLSIGGNFAAGQTGGTGSLTIGPGGALFASGVYIFRDGALVLNGGTIEATRLGLAFLSGGRFDFLAGVLHASEIGLNLVNQGGTLAPGPGAGITEIFGHYTQQAGTMELEIGGINPGLQVDQVIVGGIASLGGTLDVRLINGFVPGANQVFVAVDAGEVAGAFANVAPGQRLPVPGGGSFVVNYGPASLFGPTLVVLSDFSACRADFNGDGFLDFFDYIDYVACFESGACPPGGNADFNGDGFADFFDYLDFVTAFESGC